MQSVKDFMNAFDFDLFTDRPTGFVYQENHRS